MELFSFLNIKNTKLSSIKSSLLQEAQNYADRAMADKTDPVRSKIVRLSKELNKVSFEVKSKTARLQRLKEQLDSLAQPDYKLSSTTSISKLRTIYHVRSMSLFDQKSLLTKLQESQLQYESLASEQLKETQCLEHIRIRQKESKDILVAKLGHFRQVCDKFLAVGKDVKYSSKNSTNQLMNTQHKVLNVKNQGRTANHKRVASLTVLRLKRKDLKDSMTKLTGSVAKNILEKEERSEQTQKLKTGILDSVMDQQECKELQTRHATQISTFKKQFELLNQVASKYSYSGNTTERVLQAWEQLLKTEKHLQVRFTDLTAMHNQLIKQIHGIRHELSQNVENSEIIDRMNNLKMRTANLAKTSQNFTMNEVKNYIENCSFDKEVNDGFIIKATDILWTIFQKLLKLLKHIKLNGVNHSPSLNLFVNNKEYYEQTTDLSLKTNQFKLCIDKYCPVNNKKIGEFVLMNQKIIKFLTEIDIKSHFKEFPDSFNSLNKLLLKANANSQREFLHTLNKLSEMLNLVIQHDEEYGPAIQRNPVNSNHLQVNKSGIQNFLTAIFRVKLQQISKTRKIMQESEISTQRFKPLKSSPNKNNLRTRTNSYAQLPPIFKGNNYAEEISCIKKKMRKISSKVNLTKN